MNKKLLFFLLLPAIGLSQVQIGQDIQGGYSTSLSSYGNAIAVGNSTGTSIVRVYEETFGTWTQIGQDIQGGGM